MKASLVIACLVSVGVAQGCEAQTSPPITSVETPPATHQPEPSPVTDDPRAKALKRFITQTPYSALVQDSEVTKQGEPDDFGDVTYFYSVRVLETYRGEAVETLTYKREMEDSDNAQEPDPKPYVVTLCKTGDGYYWPGLGASMPATDALKAVAKSTAKSLDKSQAEFEDCE